MYALGVHACTPFRDVPTEREMWSAETRLCTNRDSS